MRVMVVDAAWAEELVLSKEVLSYFKKKKVSSVALFASVQFLALEKVKEQLEEAGIKTLTTKAKRTHVEGQILGCDAYHDSYDAEILKTSDAILYVGDGMFHPKALLLAQIKSKAVKDVVIWDPVNKKMVIITSQDIKAQVNRTRGNLLKFLHSSTIGILVSIKGGQQYLHSALTLQEKLTKAGKQSYIFIDDVLNLQLLENYPFIEAWVNTACPRIGTDDLTTINVPLVNVKEALDPDKALAEIKEL